MKKGLVLEGGAMRGMFTAGVIDIMMENNIEFDGAIGVSAGAAFGCNYKSRQIGRAIRYNMKFCNDKRYCGFHSLITSGNIFNTEFCYHEVPLVHDKFDFETYNSNPMDFYVVCTDVETGDAVYKNCDKFESDNFDWIRASASMPLVSKIVEIEGKKLLDGGVADSIPIKYFESIGYDRNVVVLTQPKGYVKKKNPMMGIAGIKYKKYPSLIEAMARRHEIYNETTAYISKLKANKKILVLQPEEPLPVGRIEKNPERLKETYEIGRVMAKSRLNEIKEFLSS